MEKKTKIILGVTAVVGVAGIYYMATRKKNTTLQLTDLDGQLKNAVDRFAYASPVGVTGKTPSKAELDKAYVYLQRTLSDKQKRMFIDFSNSFMGGLEKYATSSESLTDENMSGMFKVLSDTQDFLETKYGKADADSFMVFMNGFDPKKLK